MSHRPHKRHTPHTPLKSTYRPMRITNAHATEAGREYRKVMLEGRDDDWLEYVKDLDKSVRKREAQEAKKQKELLAELVGHKTRGPYTRRAGKLAHGRQRR